MARFEATRGRMSFNVKLFLGSLLVALIAVAGFAQSQLAQFDAASRASQVFSRGVEPLTALQAAQSRAAALETGFLGARVSEGSLPETVRSELMDEFSAILSRLGEVTAGVPATSATARAVDELRYALSRLRATQGDTTVRLLRRELAQINVQFDTAVTALRSDIASMRSQTGESLVTASLSQLRGLAVVLLAVLLFAAFISWSVAGPLRIASGTVRQLEEDVDKPVTVSMRGHFSELFSTLSSLQSRLAERGRESERGRAAETARLESELQRERKRFEATLENIKHGCCLLDESRNLVVANEPFRRLFGHLRNGTSADIVTNDPAIEPMLRANAPSVRVHETEAGEIVEIRRRAMPGRGIIITVENVTEHYAATRRIEELAGRDSLTGLPNRERFFAQLAGALKSDNLRNDIAVVTFDIEGFRQINTIYGNLVGDSVLREVGERLRSALGAEDFLARTGADDFSIIQPAGAQPEECRRLGDAIGAALKAPVRIEGSDIPVRGSIGMVHLKARRSRAPLDPYAVMQDAEMALERARRSPTGAPCLFSDAMRQEMDARRQLEADLRQALAGQQLEIFYQPFVDVTRGTVSGFEALLRWRHPTQGVISPGVFIPVAEETGLIEEIGLWVLAMACRQATSWPASLTLSVNLSPVQFRSRTLVRELQSILTTSGLDPARLQLEVTESVFLGEIEGTLEKLSALRALGLTISMDDFGTGYSSLGYLSRFPFDKIKIDQGFVRTMHKPENEAIVRAVIGLSAAMRISVIAEGVETREQFDMLCGEGCGEMQGYLFARPCPAAELPKLLLRIDTMFSSGEFPRLTSAGPHRQAQDAA